MNKPRQIISDLLEISCHGQDLNPTETFIALKQTAH